jgi:hypothetical protein
LFAVTDLSAEDIRSVWDGQVQPVSPALIPANVPAATREFLTTIGLPTVPVLDITFIRDDRLATPIRRGDRNYLVFAENTSDSVFVVDLESERVYRTDRVRDKYTSFYNSSLALFVYFHGLLQKNVLSLEEVTEQLLVDAVNSVWDPLTERDPEAMSDKNGPWQRTLSDLETEWQ